MGGGPLGDALQYARSDRFGQGQAKKIMNFNDHNRECHAEPIRFAQGKLREASSCPSREILRCAQDDKRPASITDGAW